MHKNVWIINHYAGQMYFDKGMRHYWIAKFLKNKDYSPIIICSNSKHNSDGEVYFDGDNLWHECRAEEIDVPFIFVKSRPYSGNGKERILNMVDFYINVLKVAKELSKKAGKPDVIYASSVHPLTLVAGIKLAKRFGVKVICEVRDLWPESLVAYGILRRQSIVTRLLYLGEKWIYQKADRIVMTWPGGYEYICDKHWETRIPKNKVVCISNGIDLAEYKENISAHMYNNSLFDEYQGIKMTYTGSVRKVNNLGTLIKAVEVLRSRNINNFRLYVFGDGDERKELEDFVNKEQLENVFFMGKIPKLQIPSVLSKSNINVLHNSSTSLDKYGQSQNKFFEYLAAEKPILMTYKVGYSIVREEKCGFEVEQQTPESIADCMQELICLSEEQLDFYSQNARRCAERYDFRVLTEKMISLIEDI